MTDSTTFEAHRPALLALAYRMLGDLGRAEDVVQEAWLRWQGRAVTVDAPRGFLLTTVTHLCLDELGSARARREESRSDRLPEPVDLDRSGIGRLEMLDQISMAFLVMLQRLTPAERAVFLLHEVFDLSHREIGERLGKTEEACRQLFRRAKDNVAVERRALATSKEEHHRLLHAFVGAVVAGDQNKLVDLLADDATMIVDGGATGQTFGKLRSVNRPVVGPARIIPLVRAFAMQDVALVFEERRLNGDPAIVALLDGVPFSALFVTVLDGRIRSIYLQIDPERLHRIH